MPNWLNWSESRWWAAAAGSQAGLLWAAPQPPGMEGLGAVCWGLPLLCCCGWRGPLHSGLLALSFRIQRLFKCPVLLFAALTPLCRKEPISASLQLLLRRNRTVNSFSVVGTSFFWSHWKSTYSWKSCSTGSRSSSQLKAICEHWVTLSLSIN